MHECDAFLLMSHACYMCVCRYMLQDWSGSLVTSLCPVATRSASSRQNSNVNECSWDGNSVLKVRFMRGRVGADEGGILGGGVLGSRELGEIKFSQIVFAF